MTVDLRRGRYSLVARAVDVGALLSEGPARVQVNLGIAGVVYRGVIDLDVSDRRWEYRSDAGAPVPLPPSPLPASSNGTEVAFSVLGGGGDGWQGRQPMRAFAVRTQADLDRVWAFRKGVDTAPPVDFGTSMVIIVDLGRRPTPSFRADVTPVIETDCGAFVEFSEFSPTTGDAVEGNPWSAIVTPSMEGEVTWARLPD